MRDSSKTLSFCVAEQFSCGWPLEPRVALAGEHSRVLAEEATDGSRGKEVGTEQPAAVVCWKFFGRSLIWRRRGLKRRAFQGRESDLCTAFVAFGPL